jgi:hypothetical protein
MSTHRIFPLPGRIPNAEKRATERKFVERSTGIGDALRRRKSSRKKRTRCP